jgi:hypothetical protein
MSRDVDIEPILDRWFQEGPTEVADRVIEGALDVINGTEQRHTSRRAPRSITGPAFLKLAAAAVIVVVVGGFAFAALQSRPCPPSARTAPRPQHRQS